jgi:3-phosphoshikimate 1-carboxyvinyltransferase
MRLLAGLLSYKKIPCTLVGDKSLSSRPMKRIINPLTKMGNQIISENGCAPITLGHFLNQSLDEFEIPIPSAQVKSCLILAALGCERKTKIIEKIKTRDHLELMLSAIDSGIIEYDNKDIIVHPIKEKPLQKFDIELPGDASSASYLVAAAVILDDSRLVINDLLLNPQRMGFINTLVEMGANIEIDREETRFNERIGRLTINGGRDLRPIYINKDKIPSMIDEIPILSLICAYVEGESVISGVEELRYKESDRLKGIYDILEAMGVKATLHNEDQIRIKGKNKLYNTNKLPDSNDHRLAMMISIAQIVSGNSVSSPDCINVSFPNFKNLIKEILETS